MIIRSKRIYADRCIDGIMVIQNGKITSIREYDNETIDLDFEDKIIYPGFIDTHNHGNCGFDLRSSDESEADTIGFTKKYLSNLANFGITGVFPTCSYDNIACMRKAADSRNKGAKILGIHVEGPWLKRAGEKGKPATYIEPTKEIASKMVKDGEGLLKLVAVSPDIENIDNITSIMNENKICLSLAHTNFGYEETIHAIKQHNFKTITHLGNAMRGIHHRDVGALGAGLLVEDMYCEFVGDFIHLCKEMVQIILKMKNHDRLMLVSDNSHLTQLPKGRYRLDDGYVDSDGEARLITETGKIQGSNCSVLYGFKNLVNQLGISLEEAWKFTSYNACIHYEIENRGKLAVGYFADFIVLNDELEVEQTYSEGQLIFDKRKDCLNFNEAFINVNKL